MKRYIRSSYVSDAINKFNIQLLVPLFSVAQPKTKDTDENQALSNAAYSILLPGNVLYLSVLLAQTKFKTRGKKAGTLAGWKLLEKSGLAKLIEMKAQRGTDKVRFINHALEIIQLLISTCKRLNFNICLGV